MFMGDKRFKDHAMINNLMTKGRHNKQKLLKFSPVQLPLLEALRQAKSQGIPLKHIDSNYN